MKTTDLIPEEIDAIDRTAVLLYTSNAGATSVFDLARMLRWEEYNRCEPCEEDTPTLNGGCMVCGTSTEAR